MKSAQAEYAALLIDLEMGRSTDKDRKFELRTEIRGLESDIANFQILALGFKKEKAKIAAMNNKVRQIIRGRKTYLEIKDKLTEQGPGIAFVSELRLWANTLGCIEDAEDFLVSLSETVKA